MKDWHMISYALMVIGALNWGLVGLLDINLVEMLLGFSPMLVKIVYIVVGLSALIELISHKECCKWCKEKK